MPAVDEATAANGRNAELVSRWAEQRDEAALGDLITQHWEATYRLCKAIVGDPATAEDCAQKAFLAIVRNASQLRRTDAFPAWLRAVSVNTSRRALRAKRRRRSHESHERVQTREAHVVEADPLESHETARELDRQLVTLPEPLRVAIELHYLQGLTHRAIASALDCPVGTVASRIRRGLEMLRGRMKPGLAMAALLALLSQRSAQAAQAAAPPPPTTEALLAKAKAAARWTRRAVTISAVTISAVALIAVIGSAGWWIKARSSVPGPVAQQAAAPHSRLDAPKVASSDVTESPSPGDPQRTPAIASATPSSVAAPAASTGPAVPDAAPGDTGLLVLDATTGAPIAGAIVHQVVATASEWWNEEAPPTRTDANGRTAVITAPTETIDTRLLLCVRAPGHQPFFDFVDREQPIVVRLEPGEGALVNGRVVDQAGVPVSGRGLHVLFTFSPEHLDSAEQTPDLPELPMLLQSLPVAYDGSFVAADLPRSVVFAWPEPGHGISLEGAPEIRWAAPQAAAALRLVVRRTASLEVRVPEALLTGRPAAVTLERYDDSTRLVKQGRVVYPDLAEGSVTVALAFARRGDASVEAVGRRVLLLPDETRTVPVTVGEHTVVTLSSGPPETGDVAVALRYPDGSGASDVELWLRRADGAWPMYERQRTAADATARWTALAQGRYQIRVADAEDEAFVSVSASPTEVTLTIPPRREVRGVVVDESGAGLAEVEVAWTRSPDPFSTMHERRAVTDSSGAFALAPAPLGPLSLIVRGLYDATEVRSVTFDGTELRVVRTETARSVTLQGRLTGASGSQLEGTPIETRLTTGSRTRLAGGQLRDGRFTIRFDKFVLEEAGYVEVFTAARRWTFEVAPFTDSITLPELKAGD